MTRIKLAHIDAGHGSGPPVAVGPLAGLISAPVRTSMEELHTRIDKFQAEEIAAHSSAAPPEGEHSSLAMRDGTVADIPGEPIGGLVQIRRSPHIPRPIDNTALADYMACPRKFFYGMVLNRRRMGATPPALAFGTSWHAALEAHYKTGGDRASVEMAIIQSWEQHDRPDDHRTMERVLSCYVQYCNHWGDHATDTSRNGRTVGFPENPMVEIPVELAWPGGAHPYTGKIDRIIEINGLYYVEDHKSTSQLGAQYFQQYDPSNQMMGYAWLAQKLTGLRIAGVRINALGVLKTQTKLAREIISYSKERLEEWAENYNSWVARVESSYKIVQDYNADVGIGNLEDTPERARSVVNAAFPHNFQACAGKYGMCQYAAVCAFQPARRDYVLSTEYSLKEWDPMQVFSPEDVE